MQSFAEVLKLVKEYFVEKVKNNELTETAYNCWIKNIEPIRLENNTAVLFVPHNFHRNILVEQYKSRIEEAFEAVLGFKVNVEILTDSDVNEEELFEPALISSEAKTAPPQENKDKKEDFLSGEYDYTFENFIVGSKNLLTLPVNQ